MGWASEGSKYIGVAPISINSQGGIGLNIAKPLAVNTSNNLSIPNSLSSTQNSFLDITYSSDTTLTSNVYANNVTIDSGVTITTNGYIFLCTGTFTNNGTLDSGNINNGGSPLGGGGSFTNSYGGSGGGGGTGSGYCGAGGATSVGGGADGYISNGGNGNTSTAPTLSSSLINSWYIDGINNYLAGGGGGGGNGSSGGGSGNGIYIQAQTIIAGTITTIGETGGDAPANSSTSGGGGGGGGGSILLAYGSGGYTAGTYNMAGGSGGKGENLAYNGGAGGSGIVMEFSGTPITFSVFSYTSSGTTGMINRISSYSYTKYLTSSTSPTAIISQSFTPRNSGLVTIKAVVSISNNTIGDGVEVGLYNGSTLLDSEGFTQEGLASNTHEITLYTEQQFTSPFSIQTYSIQINVVTGGTATAEIQQFEINEVF